jgi:hypothetical protein
LPYALAAAESHGAPAYVVYKVGGDPTDHQFFNEPPKEIPHGYMCAYIPDSNNPIHLPQKVAGGVSGADADKQAWLATYATGPSHDSMFSSGWDLPQSGKSGFGHHERKTKKKIGITVHVGAPMDLIVLRSAGFRGFVAWRRPRPSTSRP